jgi:hypothetical protein
VDDAENWLSLAMEAMEAMEASGADIEDITLRQPSLDEVFLTLTNAN